MLKASKHEAYFKIRNRLRAVRDDHVIGIRCKHSNVLSRDVLISRFLLGNLRATENFVLLYGMNNSAFTFTNVLKI